MSYVLAVGAQGFGGPSEEHMKMMEKYRKAIEQYLSSSLQEELKLEYEEVYRALGLEPENRPKLPFK
jgi:hypothetical protein